MYRPLSGEPIGCCFIRTSTAEDTDKGRYAGFDQNHPDPRSISVLVENRQMFVAVDVAVNDQFELPEASGFFELLELVQKKNHGK